jgi:hypothetical protein
MPCSEPGRSRALRRKIARLVDRSWAAFSLPIRETDGLERERRPRRFLSCTVPPGPPPPSGEAPHPSSSKARSFRATSRESTTGRARGSACGLQPSDAGDNVLEDDRRATPEELEGRARRRSTILGGVAERRDADLSVPPTLYYWVFEAPASRSNATKTKNQDGQRVCR